MRVRLRWTTWPRPAVVLADTPRPSCPDCRGHGGWDEPYGDPETGEYAGEHSITCTCWDPDRSRTLLPVPWPLVRLTRRLVRRLRPRRNGWGDGFSDEPPF